MRLRGSLGWGGLPMIAGVDEPRPGGGHHVGDGADGLGRDGVALHEEHVGARGPQSGGDAVGQLARGGWRQHGEHRVGLAHEGLIVGHVFDPGFGGQRRRARATIAQAGDDAQAAVAQNVANRVPHVARGEDRRRLDRHASAPLAAPSLAWPPVRLGWSLCAV